MIKKLLFILLVLFFNTKYLYAEFSIRAKTAILQDFHSGEILFQKDPDMNIYPA